ncbi:MAG: hypothetical protein WBP81_00925 [Solirubrobacteraceae bacterium]
MHPPQRLALAARVSCVADPECEAMFPDQLPAIVRVRTRAGERREIRLLANRGGPGRPVSDHQLALKFRLNVGLTVSDDGQLAALTEALEQLEQLPDVGALLTLTALPRD